MSTITYKIKSSTDKVLEISEKALNQSKTLAQLIDNLQYNQEPIPVANVSDATLQRVVEWCEHHKDDVLTDDDADEAGHVEFSDWDKQFLAIDNQELHDLICAADYLNIVRLLKYSCKKVAELVRGKSPNGIRKFFGLALDADEYEDVAYSM